MRRLSRASCLAAAVAALVSVPLVADGGPAHQVPQTPPIKLGTSGGSADDIGHAFCCGGTLGSAVLYGGELHILSNNHILARAGSAAAGEAALQPGLIDTACRAAGTIVGDFIGDVVPLGTNVDAALALARPGMVDPSGAILDLPVPPCSVPVAPAPNQPVLKSGRTSGCVNGVVQAVDVSVKVQYQKGCNEGRKFFVNFTNQVTTTDISAGGDSGSLILSQEGLRPVALLYAGSSTLSVGNPIQEVIDRFESTGKSFSFVGTRRCMTSFSCPQESAASDVDGAAATSRVGPSEAEIDSVRRVKERHESAWLARRDVLGVGVGAAEDDPTRAAIVIYVEAADNARPRPAPARIDGVAVRIIPTGRFVAL